MPKPSEADDVRPHVKAVLDELRAGGDNGLWRPCTGCYETSDGYNVNGHPFSKAFGCYLGSGCHECGGIGAIWDTTDYEKMAREMMAPEPSINSVLCGIAASLIKILDLPKEGERRNYAFAFTATRDGNVAHIDEPTLSWKGQP